MRQKRTKLALHRAGPWLYSLYAAFVDDWLFFCTAGSLDHGIVSSLPSIASLLLLLTMITEVLPKKLFLIYTVIF